MAINSTAQDFLDYSTEIIGKKSGLLLTKSDFLKISSESIELELLKSLCTAEARKWFRIYPDEFELMISLIRKHIGNLKNSYVPAEYLVEFLHTMTNDKIKALPGFVWVTMSTKLEVT